MHRAIIEINEKALQHNLAFLKQHVTSACILNVLKANAYGHGLINIAKSLEPMADGFGVACVHEALQLRKAGIRNTIVVLEGGLSKEEYRVAAKVGLDMVIHDDYQYEWLKACPFTQPIRVWLKVNTGMNRLGVPFQRAFSLIEKLIRLQHVNGIVVMSHLSCADQLEHPATKAQYNIFNQMAQTSEYPKLSYSLANSAGMLGFPNTHYDWVRVGLALYGISPFKEPTVFDRQLRPVMTLKSKIIAIQTLEENDCVGYYRRFQCKSNTRVGLVSFGYGDGYPYNAPCGTSVLLGERRVPLVGQVSMDMLAIDVSEMPNACVGDEVILWGEQLSLKEVARNTNRSPYELLCGVQREAHTRLHVQMT